MKNLNSFIRTLLCAAGLIISVAVSAQAPPNDLICNATPLSVQLGCTQATNVNATTTGSPAVPTCWAPNNASNDVWFSFVATVPDITVSTDAQGLTLTNTQVAVYSSSNNTCTGTLTLVACAENSGFNVANNSVTDMTLIVGNTYFIRVDGNGTATGTFCINVYDTYTPGSKPCEAQIVHPNNNGNCNIDNGNLITNSTQPASAYFPIGTNYGGCDDETNQYGTWTTFTANTTSVTVQNTSGGARDYTFFEGSCTSPQWISCTSVANNASTTFSGLTVGSTYYILTTLQNSATTQNFTTNLCATSSAPCTPPANNNCSNAQALVTNTLYHVTTYCATPDNPPALCSGTLQNNIWFTWTCPTGWTGQVYFQLFTQNCAGGSSSQGTQVSIYNSTVTCGGTANCVATSNTVNDNNINVVWTPTVGATYLINYDGYAGEVCEMEFQITNTASVVVISVNSASICQGDSVTLTATSAATGYAWSTGQTGPSITVSPSNTTSYTVSATAGGTGAATATVTVNPIPAAPTAGSNSPICAGSTLSLTASTIANADYTWFGPNNFTSAQQNPTIANATTAASGTYSVFATVANCPSDTVTVTAVVNPVPAAPTAGSNSPLCAGGNLSLTATGDPNASYNWTGPNGFTSTQQNPTINGVTTAASGTYEVTQTVAGCTSAGGTTSVTVNPIPSTTAGSNSPICEGAALNLTATTVAGGTFTWTGPNGFTSNLQNPTIPTTTAADAGTYSVTVSANGCTGNTSTANVVVTLIASPVAGSNSPICAGATLNLSASAISGATYTWTGPNGFTSNQQNPSIVNATANNAGTYFVTANVGGGCNASAPDSVVVVVNPIPGVTAGSNSPVCAGGTINLTATTFPGATYSWTGPNGFTSNQQNPAITNATTAMSGTYSVTSNASGCASTTPSTVTVSVVATAPPTAGNNGPVCSGATVNLTATTIAGATYSWTGPNGFTSNLQNPSIPNATTAASGTYSVIASLNGCSSSSPATTNVVVNPLPAVIANNNGPVCAGSTLLLTASTVAGATYTWSGPNGFTSAQQNPTIPNATVAATGTYSVTVSASGCSSAQPATTQVVVNAIPAAPTAGSNSPLCAGSTINLTAGTVAIANYTWTGPNGFISQVQNPVIPNATTANTGQYNVRVTVNGCTSPQGSTVVVVNGIPASTTAGSNSPVCEGDAINLTSSASVGATYSWTGPNNFTSSQQNPTIANATVIMSGAYLVAVTVNGCTGDADTVDVVVNPLPASPVPGSNSPVCYGGTLLLTASTIPNATYLWTDPIGFPNNNQNPVVTNVGPQANGIYTVVAIVNGCVSPPATINVVVSPAPAVSFTSTAPVCAGLPVDFTNTGTTGASYFWDFGPDATPPTSTLENPTGIVFATGGTKTIIFTIITPGCSVSDTGTIQITGTPLADFTSDAPVCFPPGIVTFTDASVGTGISSWSWDFGPGATPATSTSQGPISVTYATTGTKSVMLTVNSGGCVNTTTKTVDVGVVGADFTSSVPQNGDGGCLGNGENFYNIGSSGSGASHYWNFGAGATPATSTLENPTNIVYSTTGAKIVTHIVTANGCGLSDTITHIITINPTPTASFTSTAPVCANTPVDFTNTGSTGPGLSYAWDFGPDGLPSSATAENPTGVVYPTGGSKTVSLTVTNQFLCVAQLVQAVQINAAPLASFTTTAPACTDLPVDFANTGTGTSNTDWAWNFGAGANPATSILQQPAQVTYLTAGSKTVTLTGTDTVSGCVSTATQTFNISQTPTAAFTSNAPQCGNAGVNFTNIGSTGNNWSYTWNFGAGANPTGSTAENPTGVTYSSGGIKTVTFTVADQNCTNTQTQSIVIDDVPTVSISSTAPKCTGASIDFTNNGSTTDVTWSWNFGTDATPATSTAQNPTGVVYSTGGLKTVTLTATHISGCSTTQTITINIYQGPTASFTSTSPQCPNAAVDFTNTGTTGSGWTYIWSFGPGASPATSAQESPTGIVYSSSGDKTVSFTIADAFCSSTFTDTVTIFQAPVAAFASTAPQCTGLPVNFTNYSFTNTPDIVWDWIFDSGATPLLSSDQNPTPVVYSTPGVKTVTLTVTDTVSRCASVATQVFTIYESPVVSFTSNAPQCANTPIDFTNTGSTGGNWSYNWTFGTGANPAGSTAESPTGVTYASAGSKTVTLTVSNLQCVQTATQTIVINTTPTASFVSTAPKCTGLAVDFTNTGTATGVTWTWNLGSGATPATSADLDPVGVVYATAGTKTVTLTTTDTTSGCSVTATNTFTIYQSPTASFTSTAPQCANTGIDFTNTGTSGNNWSYSWNLGTGAQPATSTAESPSSVTYTSSGTKTVTFTISDQNCTNTTTQSITINSTPVVSFVSTAPQCTGLPVDFTNTGSTTGTSWSWNFGADATPATSTTASQAAVVYSTAGTKSVTLTGTDSVSGCSVTVTNTLTIHQSPTASFTSTAPQCANTAVDFSNTGSTGNNWSYFWNLGAGALPATSTAENPTGVIYTSSGTKTVTLTISDQNCTQTTTQTIVINSTPVTSFVSTTPQCTGLGVDFKNTGTLTGVSWNWNLGLDATPGTSTVQDPNSVVYATAGTKTVTLTTTDTLSGCSVSASNSFTIHQTPTATFTSTAPQCANVGIDFVNTGNTGGNWSYSWNFGLGASPSVATAESPTGIVYSSGGTKTVTLTISDQNCTQTSVQTIVINETPRADFTSTAPQCTGLLVNFTNLGTTNNVSWLWDFGNGANPTTSTSQDPSGVVYSTSGIKTVTLVTTNSTTNCATTATQTIIIHQSPTASFTSNAPQCANVNINFTNTGSTGTNWSYNWDFGQGATPATSSSQNPSGVLYAAGGTKVVTLSISDANCISTDTQTIVISDLPAAFAGNDTTICANRSVQLGTTAVGGNAYSWFPSSTLDNPFVANPTASPVAPVTNYIVTVVNTATGCSNSDVVVITMLGSLNANAGVDAEICLNDSVQIGAGLVEGQFYQWTPADGLSSTTVPNPVAMPSTTTTYTLIVTDTSGCDAITDNVTVIVRPLPTANAGADDTITEGATVQLVGTGGLQYSWSPVEGLSNANLFNPVAQPDSTTDYVLTVTDLFGCTNTDTVRITVINFTEPYWLPSAFTPDANGHNDVLYVRGGGFKTFQFSIFNRYGEMIFIAKDIKTGWDGKNQFTSDDVPADAYVWKLNGVLENDEKVDAKGLVNLIR